MYTTLIEPAELARIVNDDDVAILDCRHDLARPQWSDEAYVAGHIPGAVQAHLDRNLSSPVGPQTGRHPLPEVAKLAETLGRWGIDTNVQVIAYDQANSAYAARAWWLLRWLGHEKVAVLNGGFAAWQETGLPVSRDPVTRKPRTFTPRLKNNAFVTAAQVQQALTSHSIALIDARTADRFAGQNETIDPIAGHIPGATNHPFTKNLDTKNRFLPAEELRRQWTDLLGTRPATEVVTMCGSGVTACHNLLALELANLPGAKLYPGSWSEWIKNPTHPVTKGP